MQKKFEINQTKIKGGCQLGRKVVTHNSKSDLPLVTLDIRYLYVTHNYQGYIETVSMKLFFIQLYFYILF